MKFLLGLVCVLGLGTGGAFGDNHQRPCQKNDLDCIQRFFVGNFKCTPGSGNLDVIKVKQQRFDLPVVGMAATINNVKITGLDQGKIQEFYINNQTDSLVMEVVFDRIVIDSEKTQLVQYREGRGPLTLEDYTSAEFKDLSLTLIVSSYSNSDSATCYVFSLIPKVDDVSLKKGPGLEGIDTSDFFVIARDAMLTEGKNLMKIYLRSMICDMKCFDESVSSDIRRAPRISPRYMH